MNLIIPIIKDKLNLDLTKYKNKILLFNNCSDRFIDECLIHEGTIDHRVINKRISLGNLINSANCQEDSIIGFNDFEIEDYKEDIVISDKFIYISAIAKKEIGELDGWFPYTCEIEDYCLRASLKGLTINFKIPFESIIDHSDLTTPYKNFSKQMLYIKYSLSLSLSWSKVFDEVNKIHSWSEKMIINA